MEENKPKKKIKLHIRASVVAINIVYILFSLLIYGFQWFCSSVEFSVSSLNPSPRFYQMPSTLEKVLFFKQTMYGLNVLLFSLVVFWIMLNVLIYRIKKKKSPQLAEPANTLFPTKLVNAVLCVINVAATSAVGILLTIKENAYAYSGLNGKVLDYLFELNGIAAQIWLLLLIEALITLFLLVFGKLSAKQTLLRLSFCVASFLPFIICTIPFFIYDTFSN